MKIEVLLSNIVIFKAIRRLSGDDEDLRREFSEILNKVYLKGDELRQIISELKKFQKEEKESERYLNIFEGNCN